MSTDPFDHNRKLAIRYLKEIIGEWNYDNVHEIMHPEYSLSDASVDIALQKEVGLVGMDAFIERTENLRKGMPNQKFHILKIIAEENSAITWWSWEGTQTGDLFGFPPKNRSMKVFGTMFFEIRDKLIYSTIVNFDTFSFLIQLGHASIKVDEDDLVMKYLKSLEELGPL